MDSSIITLLFLLFTIVMFVSEKIPLALTVMLTSMGLVLTNVLEPAEAFAGFVDSNVILYTAMFVIGGALFKTGMAKIHVPHNLSNHSSRNDF